MKQCNDYKHKYNIFSKKQINQLAEKVTNKACDFNRRIQIQQLLATCKVIVKADKEQIPNLRIKIRRIVSDEDGNLANRGLTKLGIKISYLACSYYI